MNTPQPPDLMATTPQPPDFMVSTSPQIKPPEKSEKIDTPKDKFGLKTDEDVYVEITYEIYGVNGLISKKRNPFVIGDALAAPSATHAMVKFRSRFLTSARELHDEADAFFSAALNATAAERRKLAEYTENLVKNGLPKDNEKSGFFG